MLRCFIPFALLLAMAACSPAPQPLALPGTLAGGWQRTSLNAISPAAAPAHIARLAPLHAFRAQYAGSTTVEVEVYQFNSATDAFEARQSWQSDGLRLVHQQNHLLLTAHALPPDPAAAASFLRALVPAL